MTDTSLHQMAEDILTGAVEGGINYWLAEESAEGNINHTQVARGEDLEVHSVTLASCTIMEDTARNIIVTPQSILRAMRAIVDGRAGQVAPYLVDYMREALRDHDASMIDAEGCDVAFQVAAFGEIVFA